MARRSRSRGGARQLALVLALAGLLLGACSSDDGDAAVDADGGAAASAPRDEALDGDVPPADDGEAVDVPTEPPADLTSDEVCALADAATVAGAIDATDVVAEPQGMSTPQCSYAFTDAEGAGTNVVVAVQRTEDDLGGRVGVDAFDHAVALNEMGSGPDAVSDVDGVGVLAALVDNGALVGMIVLAPDGHVITLFGTSLDEGSATALAEVVLAGL